MTTEPLTKKRGLFVGVTTLDCIYQAAHPPAANEKVAATKSLMVAGGPATNAAVAFAQLGRVNQATLLSVIGSHALASLIREDLQGQGVMLADLDADRLSPPPVSSIVVSAESGDRAVISRSAEDLQVELDKLAASELSEESLQGVDVVLVDGHQMAVSARIAQWANAQNIPVVVDAGSWKPHFETVLPFATAVIASDNFHPPGCQRAEDVLAYLAELGVGRRAITRGAAPIIFQEGDAQGEIEVPKVRAVDTLGAGDIFHGAFCHFSLTHTFEEALLKASRTASFACQHWGTRDWTKIYRMTGEDVEACSENEETTN
ncbi:MAG: PfkB family carbohydrate kinase [Cyanobacteria bacterium J06623_4]